MKIYCKYSLILVHIALCNVGQSPIGESFNKQRAYVNNISTDTNGPKMNYPAQVSQSQAFTVCR